MPTLATRSPGSPKLARNLVDSGRWLDETARPLLADVLGCGPLQPVA